MAKRAAAAAESDGKPVSGNTAGKTKRDPAPSRAAYRLNRLWLTPFFRVFLRIGAPLALSFAAGIWYFGNDDRLLAISAGILDIRRSVETRPEFMVQLVAIEGGSPAVDRLIRESFPMELPISSFDLDLELMQAEMAELDVVESVTLRVRPGGVLEISLKERQPAVVWRSRAGTVLLDETGIFIDTLEVRSARTDLPLLAGEGAQDHVAEALNLIRIAAPIRYRLRGLVRVGQRRWDLELTRGQHILLPENNPVSALQQVLALDQAQDLMARDLTTIDMRNPLRPTLRMAPVAIAEMRRIKAIELGEPDR
ncbi:MAG: cell division protein FtsQ [Rhodobacteraceae bacterium]|nr:cell division protein FtsQ [Paracoccaceae bacterium]